LTGYPGRRGGRRGRAGAGGAGRAAQRVHDRGRARAGRAVPPGATTADRPQPRQEGL